jgi:hypothetical protein
MSFAPRQDQSSPAALDESEVELSGQAPRKNKPPSASTQSRGYPGNTLFTSSMTQEIALNRWHPIIKGTLNICANTARTLDVISCHFLTPSVTN